ncbi:peptidoglycan-binding protein [Actinoplanes awajinensis]|uniref:Peptidoglycan binding-like domain-containing protein n=1 Tax=Actinoplanes awajinensis subsp. mycoplanecinus TaxID=135947 RepID=A0A101JEA3_9ACTN|nr:peptidoglycan-binding protein [Actinoplanes awajinensis]KUL25154.1 hypothetical protein ADL15_41460 [Actinoplanes awajinensis subsp. mycoplanecinus]
MRRRLLLAGGGWLLWPDRSAPVAASTGSLPAVEVRRTDLSSTAEVAGTLGFGASRGVLGEGPGRITWLPVAGAVLRRGNRVYGVDGVAVPLFYGSTPFWHELRAGVTDGYDVLELERNLAALGHGAELTVDRDFTGATAAAIRDWQRDRGRSRTGVVAPGDVVVQPGPVRVTAVRATLGGPAGGTVCTVSGTRRQVTVELPVSDAPALARTGARVRVTLPGGARVTGTITAVGTVATGSATQEARLPVTVTLPEAGTAGAFDGAPVTAAFQGSVRRGVLAVPITALLATSPDQYAVEVLDESGTVRSVPVHLGIFAGDDVEVTGDLAPGMLVRVPRT